MEDHIARFAAESLSPQPPWLNHTYYPPQPVRDIAQRAIDIYMMSKQPDGCMGGIGWWQTANGYTVMALKDLWTGDRHNYDTLSSLVRQCEYQHAGFINEFNDDSLWWAMLCMHVYTVGGDEWFLRKAEGVWNHMHTSRSVVQQRGQMNFNNMDMEGGCFWKNGMCGDQQVNSISTGLYAELSARLALCMLRNGHNHHHLSQPSQVFFGRTPSAQEYLDAAKRSLNWILRTRYRQHEAVVLDGFDLQAIKANDWTFTYNTGVVIAVSALLYEATREQDYMILACHIANYAMCRSQWVEPNGVLTEKEAYGQHKHDPGQNNDAVGFKAVLVRHLGTLYEVIQRTQCEMPQAFETAEMIRKFIAVNLQSQQERNTNGNGQYGPWWNGPFVMPTSHSQMAVLDVMAVVVLVFR